MTKSLLLVALLTFGGICFAQSYQYDPPAAIQTQLNLDEILGNQTWDIDDPLHEPGRELVWSLWNHLDAFYTAVSGHDNAGIESAIEGIDLDRENALSIPLDLSAFQADFEAVELEKENL